MTPQNYAWTLATFVLAPVLAIVLVLHLTGSARAQSAPPVPAGGPPASAQVQAEKLEAYHVAAVAFLRADAKQRLAAAELEQARAVAEAAGYDYAISTGGLMAPVPLVVTPVAPMVPPPTVPPAVPVVVVPTPALTPPSGAIVLGRGKGAVPVQPGAVVSVRTHTVPDAPRGSTITAVFAWPGGKFEPKAIDASGPWTVEASLDGGPLTSTRDGVFWIDGTTDGDYQVYWTKFNIAQGAADRAEVQAPLVLNRATTAGVVVWTLK